MDFKQITEQLNMSEAPCDQLYSISPDKNLAEVLPMIHKYFNRNSELPPEFGHLQGQEFDNLFILFTDSLGLSSLNNSNSYLNSVYDSFGAPYSTVFPSITNVALTSFYTGSLPAEHGIPGFKIAMPEIGGIVDNLLLKVPGAKSTLPEAGVDCKNWWHKNTLFGPDSFPGKDLYVLQPHHIIGSGLSTVLYHEDSFQYPYSYTMEGFKRAEYILENSPGAVVNLYIPGPDTIMHRFGPGSDMINFYIKQLGEQLKKFISEISTKTAKRTLFLMVSDHGQAVNNSTELDIDLQQKLFEDKKYQFLGFSGRCQHLYGPPEEIKHTVDFLRKHLGDCFEVLDLNTVTSRYNNGIKPCTGFAERNGTLISFKPGSGLHLTYKRDSETMRDPLYKLQELYNGQHGGASLDELLIPVVISSIQSLQEVN
jgi:hypothetical protein